MPTHRLPAARAAPAGLLAVAGALGVGHLVAGLLLAPSASPFLAVGNAAIDRTPTPVKDFAIDQFGTNDKLVLLLGMAVVLALVGIAIGLLSRGSPWPGLGLVAALGVVGFLAVLKQSGSDAGVLAPAAALAAGLATFWWLHRLARPATGDTAGDLAPRRPVARRRFLAGSAGVAAGAAVAGVAGSALTGRIDVTASRRAVGPLVPDVPAPPIPPGAAFPELGTPTFITPNAEFYRVDINLTVPRLRAQDAVLRITGMVDEPVELTFDEIRSRRLVEKTITMTCVSNYVGGPYVSTSNFLGVPLADLLAEAGVQPGATQLVGRSVDGFTIGTPLRQVLDAGDEALLAIGMNREPLLAEHGFPLRTVVPGLYGYVSATKWLTELELTTFEFDPYWEERGWDGDPEGIVPIKISSKITAPAGFARIPAGDVTVVGAAWAQGRGIQRVEVRFDGGPWQPAELGAPVNVHTWRMWRLTEPLEPGLHSVTVRAVDGTGTLQAEERVEPINPGPDGATGWHTVQVTVV